MDNKKFFDNIRKDYPLTNTNVNGFDRIVSEGENRNIPLPYLSYILATAWHETASTMQPIAEYGKGKGRKYGAVGKYGQVPYGRGYVQLTWDMNYEKADKELGLNGKLLKNFDLALDPEYAIPILFVGMEKGWFTGKKLSDYIDLIDESDSEDRKEYSDSRRIINGTDRASMIANHAINFEHALRGAGYGLKQSEKPVETIPEVPSAPVPSVPKRSVWARVAEIIINLISAILRGK